MLNVSKNLLKMIDLLVNPLKNITMGQNLEKTGRDFFYCTFSAKIKADGWISARRRLVRFF
jgi:hypothetical protein